MKPFTQGDLDGLCTIYACINATKLLTRITQETAETLFLSSVLNLEKEKCLSKFITEGTTTLDLSRILRDTICKQFNIHRSKPFHKNSNVGLNEFWAALSDFLKPDKPRTAIISIENKVYAHCTVVESINDKRIKLFDSYKRKVINRSYCTTTELTERKTTLITPIDTYFLERYD